jgi:thiol:disulfide interchange protein DsbC
MMKLIRTLCTLTFFVYLSSTAVVAADVSDADYEKILKVIPELSRNAISPSPIPGLYQIMMGGEISYVSADGRYLVQGDIYDLEEERNLTEVQRETARQSAIDKIGENRMIVFSPDKVEHSITVFTDIDCGYCRKLHRQIDGYNQLGIEVRYLFFPRSGPDTDSWFKAESVWCADDRNSALTQAKSGATIDSDDCSSTPVEEHYKLGRTIGIRGTPAIIVQGGELIPGYVSPNELLTHLEE